MHSASEAVCAVAINAWIDGDTREVGTTDSMNTKL